MSPVKILIADDEPDIRSLLEMSLSLHFDVVVARDGLEAWKLFQEEQPRLVLTDLNMPGLNGWELTEKIRDHEELADTPVIILTATTQDTDLPPGFWRIGTRADAFLQKPLTTDEILQEVRRQLVKRQAPNPLPPGKGHY
ncbi:MAG: response regulator [Candidatus Sumerlaeia bacterium]|nr:response regulator [Candidatus Sumerlaeia bacterium]